MAADAGQVLEEVAGSELSFNQEVPPEPLYRMPQPRRGRPHTDNNDNVVSIPGIV